MFDPSFYITARHGAWIKPQTTKSISLLQSNYVNAVTSVTHKLWKLKNSTISLNRRSSERIFKKEDLLILDIYCKETPPPEKSPSHHPSETRERCQRSSSQPHEDLQEQSGHQCIPKLAHEGHGKLFGTPHTELLGLIWIVSKRMI